MLIYKMSTAFNLRDPINKLFNWDLINYTQLNITSLVEWTLKTVQLNLKEIAEYINIQTDDNLNYYYILSDYSYSAGVYQCSYNIDVYLTYIFPVFNMLTKPNNITFSTEIKRMTYNWANSPNFNSLNPNIFPIISKTPEKFKEYTKYIHSYYLSLSTNTPISPVNNNDQPITFNTQNITTNQYLFGVIRNTNIPQWTTPNFCGSALYSLLPISNQSTPGVTSSNVPSLWQMVQPNACGEELKEVIVLPFNPLLYVSTLYNDYQNWINNANTGTNGWNLYIPNQNAQIFTIDNKNWVDMDVNSELSGDISYDNLGSLTEFLNNTVWMRNLLPFNNYYSPIVLSRVFPFLLPFIKVSLNYAGNQAQIPAFLLFNAQGSNAGLSSLKFAFNFNYPDIGLNIFINQVNNDLQTPLPYTYYLPVKSSLTWAVNMDASFIEENKKIIKTAQNSLNNEIAVRRNQEISQALPSSVFSVFKEITNPLHWVKEGLSVDNYLLEKQTMINNYSIDYGADKINQLSTTNQLLAGGSANWNGYNMLTFIYEVPAAFELGKILDDYYYNGLIIDRAQDLAVWFKYPPGQLFNYISTKNMNWANLLVQCGATNLTGIPIPPNDIISLINEMVNGGLRLWNSTPFKKSFYTDGFNDMPVNMTINTGGITF